MDLDSNFFALELSLKKMCAVVVVEQLLEVSGRRPDTDRKKTDIVKEATERMEELELPLELKVTLQELVMPIDEELETWYIRLCFRNKPVWTPHAAVDTFSSTKILMEDETLDDRMKFSIACHYGHVKYIYTIGKRLEDYKFGDEQNCCKGTANPIKFWPECLKWNLACLDDMFWRAVHRSSIVWQGAEDVPQQVINLGFRIAIKYCDAIALKFFTKNACELDYAARPDSIRILCSRCTLSPSTAALLVSKLSKICGVVELKYLSCLMLKSLLNNPYQQFFLRAAVLLVDNLYLEQLRQILETLDAKTANGFKDWDYDRLTISFSRMFIESYRKMVEMPWHYAVMHMSLTVDCERLTECAVNDMSDEEKEALMMDRSILFFCNDLLARGHHKTFATLIRGCGMGRMQVLVSLKTQFTDLHNDCIPDTSSAALLTLFLTIMDKIIADADTSCMENLLQTADCQVIPLCTVFLDI